MYTHDSLNFKTRKDFNINTKNSFVPVINKPNHVTKNTAAAIDHIITNLLLHRTIQGGNN